MFTRTSAFLLSLTVLLSMWLGPGLAQAEPRDAGHVIVDMAGRKVWVPVSPTRVVTAGGTPAINSFLFVMGKGHLIVNGLPRFMKGQESRWRLHTMLAPQLANLPAISEPPDWVPEMESLLALRPDIAFVVDAVSAEAIQSRGVPAVVLTWKSADSVTETMALLGDIFSEPGRVQDYLDYRRQVLVRIAAATEGVPKDARPTAMYGRMDTMTQPMGTTARWLIDAAGGAPVPGSVALGALDNLPFTTEQLLAWNPSLLIVMTLAQAEQTLRDERLRHLAAVKTKQVYPVPRGGHLWTHYTPEQPLGLWWMAKLLHPDRFQSLDLEAETKAFYSRFFGLTVSDEQVQAILSGLP